MLQTHSLRVATMICCLFVVHGYQLVWTGANMHIYSCLNSVFYIIESDKRAGYLALQMDLQTICMAFLSIEFAENALQSCLKKSEGENFTIHMFVSLYFLHGNRFTVYAVGNPIS